MIKLKNTLRRPFEATEYHDIVCRHRNVCKCARQPVVTRDGKASTRPMPRGFRVDGLAESVPLDAEVLLIPQVADAVKAGWLVKIDLPITEEV